MAEMLGVKSSPVEIWVVVREVMNALVALR